MDEFHRKRARNDHTLLTLWELGVRDLRVPAADLLEPEVRDRMRAMVAMGHRFTVFIFGMPDARLVSALETHRDLVTAFETVIPWADANSAIAPLTALRARTGLTVQLSKMETSAEKKTEGSKFSHFISYGFRLAEGELVDRFLELEGAREAVDVFVFRSGPESRPWADVAAVKAWAAARDVGAVVNIRLASDNPAEYAANDDATSLRVAEALAAAHGNEPVAVFLDTYVDLDRGYFPRHGLFDRRYNPRPASFVYRHLQGLLAAEDGPLRAAAMETTPQGSVVLPLDGPSGRLSIVLGGGVPGAGAVDLRHGLDASAVPHSAGPWFVS
jgi:hypothetical protein